MTDEAITIMAKAILDDNLHEIALPQRCVAISAVALEALRAAGYWVERWRPIEEAPPDTALVLGWPEEVGHLEWRHDVDYAHSTRGGWWHGRATHFAPLPLPPVQTEGGGG